MKWVERGGTRGEYFDRVHYVESGANYPVIINVPGQGVAISPHRYQSSPDIDIPQPDLKTAKIVVETMILLNEFPEGFM